LPEVICNTSPLQYLHQIGRLGILCAVAKQVIIPPAVVSELAEGRSRGVDLPSLDGLAWVTVRTPVSAPATSLIADLGPGETQVLLLAPEMPGAVVVLDDARARRVAELQHTPLIGTLGLLLDAKRAGSISTVKPCLDQLQRRGFRLAAPTRAAVLKPAGEHEER
jgi:predicted nucleic acid-binding protein